MAVKPPPEFTSHCTVGVGVPLAEAVNVAVWPTITACGDGSPVMARLDDRQAGRGRRRRAGRVGEHGLELVAALTEAAVKL